MLGGLALFAGAALVGEGVMWPAERRLQVALTSTDVPPPVESLDRDAAAMSRAATTGLVLLVAGLCSWWRNPDWGIRRDASGIPFVGVP